MDSLYSPVSPEPAVVAERAEFERRVAGQTLGTAFLATVERRVDAVALRRPSTSDRPEVTWTWGEYAARVAAAAGGLRRLGLGRGEPVAILCRNRPEFHVADVAALFAGGIPFSVYNSSPPDQLAYLLAHSGATIVIAEDAGFAARVLAVHDRLPRLRHIVVVEPEPVERYDTEQHAVDIYDDEFASGEFPDRSRSAAGPRLLSWAELTGGPPLDLGSAAAEITPDDPATVIYTSGTTGEPKGVVLSHHNIRYAIEVHLQVSGVSLAGLRQLSYLPMAHIGERQVTHYYHLIGGTDVTTCDDLARLPELMVRVRPQWWFCAPRLWEKLRAGVEAGVAADPERARRFAAALDLGWQVFTLRNDGSEPPDELARDWATARAEVIGPELARIGLDDVVQAITGAAPIASDTLRFWLACGVPLSDVYGSSETSGFMSWSPHHIVLGTQGRPLPGLEMRLDDDGEVLVRAPSVFAGYLRDPDRTREALSADGWYRTGDIGRWHAGGHLSIIDRKKEILVPTSGHKVSPVRLENAVKTECPLVGQACAIGDGRPYVAMLLVLDPDATATWAARHHRAGTPPPELAALPELRAEVAAAVDRVNATLAPAERIRAHHLLGDAWLPDTDLLTPTMKLKRRGVHARYPTEIAALYP